MGSSSTSRQPATARARARRYWCAVAAKAHVDRGMKLGFAQVCHGAARPLSRMKQGDGIVYYSPAHERGGAKCQCFSSIGLVSDARIYQVEEGGFAPHRRSITYFSSEPVPIHPLLPELSFTAGRTNWGAPFRFGLFELKRDDFCKIISRMCRKPLRRAQASHG
jgi:hypothetical protein